MNAHEPTRRDALRSLAFAAAAPTLLAQATSAHAALAVDTTTASLSLPRRVPTSPSRNSKLQAGIVGFGVRAREIYNGFLDDDALEIVSVADVVDARTAEGVRRVNERRKSDVCRAAKDWREVVHDPRIDVVIVTTPDHWHAEPAIVA
jgi:hypothetical protein